MSIKYTFNPPLSLKEIEEKTELTVRTDAVGTKALDYRGEGVGIIDNTDDKLFSIIFYGLSSNSKLVEIMTILKDNFDSGIFCDMDRYEINYNIKDE